MVWTSQGIVQSAAEGFSSTAPALETHHGQLWCLFADSHGALFYCVGTNDVFEPRIGFSDFGKPVLTEVLGVLHALVVRPDQTLVHYIYDDTNAIWSIPTLLDAQEGFRTENAPGVIAFHDKLFLAFVAEGILSYAIWHRDDDTWSPPKPISLLEVQGLPSLFVLNTTLHVLCAASDAQDRRILGYRYIVDDNRWRSCDDVSEGKSAVGISACSFGNSAFLAFLEAGPDDSSHRAYVAEFSDGVWKPSEDIAGETAADPPQLAVLNGRINCVFNTNDSNRQLKWYSRPLLDFELDSWMSGIEDDRLVSSLTVPGTHDTCARSNIPFVRTQYLDITQQLKAGLRFLDLRLRLHDDGHLYCYHGGIAINWPRGLSFRNVLNEVYRFMSPDDKPPTEAVFVSINNDDVAGKGTVELFYNAVNRAIDETPPWSSGISKWSTASTTITLGEARGKTLLLRRFTAPANIDPLHTIGIDLSGWLNNNPCFSLTTATGVVVTLQDRWQYIDPLPLSDLIASKLGFVTSMLEIASWHPMDHWFLNFGSAVGVPSLKGEVAESHWIAVGAHSNIIGKFVEGVNVHLKAYQWAQGKRYGILALDYPELPKDSDLITRLIATNL